MMNQGKILIGRKAIMAYLGISRKTYLKYVMMGLPVLHVDGHCHAHTDNINTFFLEMTKEQGKISTERR
jgi:hypothetical protein